MKRFWSKVNKNGPIPQYRPELGPCWIWTAFSNRGYGTFRLNGRMIYAHIASYKIVNGEYDQNFDVDHLCRVTLCVNPSHLEPITHRENVLRGASSKQFCSKGHLFDEANTIWEKPSKWQPYGRKRCRICVRAKSQRWNRSEEGKKYSHERWLKKKGALAA